VARRACLDHGDVRACDWLAEALLGDGLIGFLSGAVIGGSGPPAPLQAPASRITAVSPEAALTMRRRACRLGLQPACAWVAAEERQAELEGLSAEQLHAVLARRCRKGHQADCRMAAEALASGQGVEADPTRASADMARLCGRGEAEACELLVFGVSGLRLPDEEDELILGAACDRGVALACEVLAGHVEDLARSSRLLFLACKLGRQAPCERRVREALLAGRVNLALARRACDAGAQNGCQVLWDRACTAGDPQACSRLDTVAKEPWKPKITVEVEPSTPATKQARGRLRALVLPCLHRHPPRLRPARMEFRANLGPETTELTGELPKGLEQCLKERLSRVLNAGQEGESEDRPASFEVRYLIEG